jgi:transcriptional regulator with XRE-family HTH domain
MITGIQVKAARKLLGWSQEVLAGHAGLSVIAISNVERGRRVSDSVVRVIQEALEAEGVEFAESAEPKLMAKPSITRATWEPPKR